MAVPGASGAVAAVAAPASRARTDLRAMRLRPHASLLKALLFLASSPKMANQKRTSPRISPPEWPARTRHRLASGAHAAADVAAAVAGAAGRRMASPDRSPTNLDRH